jgi:hypothetical protein
MDGAMEIQKTTQDKHTGIAIMYTMYNKKGEQITVDREQIKVMEKLGFSRTPPNAEEVDHEAEKAKLKKRINSMNNDELDTFVKENPQYEVPADLKTGKDIKEFLIKSIG